jgi:hypothetical protein
VSTSSSCSTQTNHTLLTSPSGYLLLRPPPYPGAQTPCPWRLQSDAGRRINITRLQISSDYGFHGANDGAASSTGSVCPYVLRITDGRRTSTYDPCAASTTGSDVILHSQTSRVDVQVVWRDRLLRSGVPSLYRYRGRTALERA